MSHYSEAQPAGHPGGSRYGNDGAPWSGRHFGPPLPLKILGVVVAFLIFKPLGVAALLFLIWRSARRNGGCSFRRREGFDRATERGPWAARCHGPATRNTAYEEHKRETLKELDEEAQAFEAFDRKQREAKDREAFERFLADRSAPQNPEEPRS
jgi:Protein of unknown function (DUF2852)